MLDAFVAVGGDFVDTADIYSMWAEGNEGGDSERIIGEWITARDNRDQFVIATKVGGLPALIAATSLELTEAEVAALDASSDPFA